MLRKELDIPSDVAEAFFRDMRAFFRAKGRLEEDSIAARQAQLLQEHLPPGTKLWLSDVKQLFLEMKRQL